MIKYLNNESFEDEVKTGVVLVDFYADWCGPCKRMGEVLETMEDINILNKTPMLSSATKNLNESLTEIYNLIVDIDENSKSDEINKKSLEILLNYGIISEETANNLNESGKLKIRDYDSFIERVKENNND